MRKMLYSQSFSFAFVRTAQLPCVAQRRRKIIPTFCSSSWMTSVSISCAASVTEV